MGSIKCNLNTSFELCIVHMDYTYGHLTFMCFSIHVENISSMCMKKPVTPYNQLKYVDVSFLSKLAIYSSLDGCIVHMNLRHLR